MKRRTPRAARPTAAPLATVAKPLKRKARAGAPKRFPIVGIGASAGGLNAFKGFFGPVRPDCGAAFVLIQHLDPTRESLAASLIGSYTSMQVVQAEDDMRVQPNRVYVIPPNAYLSIHDGVLHLSPPTAPRTLRMAVDFFFHSGSSPNRVGEFEDPIVGDPLRRKG